MIVYIYALTDPVTDDVRYVGLTRSPAQRYSQYRSRGGHTKHLRNWINNLLKNGLAPVMTILEECACEEESGKAEACWIDAFRDAGFDLINYTSGGERAYTIGSEYRKALSEAAKKGYREGRRRIPSVTPETIAKIKATLKGRKCSDGWTLLNKSRIGIPLSEEHKRRVSASLKGRVISDEHRENIRQGRLRLRTSKR